MARPLHVPRESVRSLLPQIITDDHITTMLTSCKLELDPDDAADIRFLAAHDNVEFRPSHAALLCLLSSTATTEVVLPQEDDENACVSALFSSAKEFHEKDKEGRISIRRIESRCSHYCLVSCTRLSTLIASIISVDAAHLLPTSEEYFSYVTEALDIVEFYELGLAHTEELSRLDGFMDTCNPTPSYDSWPPTFCPSEDRSSHMADLMGIPPFCSPPMRTHGSLLYKWFHKLFPHSRRSYDSTHRFHDDQCPESPTLSVEIRPEHRYSDDGDETGIPSAPANAPSAHGSLFWKYFHTLFPCFKKCSDSFDRSHGNEISSHDHRIISSENLSNEKCSCGTENNFVEPRAPRLENRLSEFSTKCAASRRPKRLCFRPTITIGVVNKTTFQIDGKGGFIVLQKLKTVDDTPGATITGELILSVTPSAKVGVEKQLPRTNFLCRQGTECLSLVLKKMEYSRQLRWWFLSKLITEEIWVDSESKADAFLPSTVKRKNDAGVKIDEAVPAWFFDMVGGAVIGVGDDICFRLFSAAKVVRIVESVDKHGSLRISNVERRVDPDDPDQVHWDLAKLEVGLKA